jgi:S1-C subfamily serine protease
MVDGMEISSLADLYSALEDNKPGDRIKVEIVRGGKKSTLDLTLADREELLAR